jgi:hypothetical protein
MTSFYFRILRVPALFVILTAVALSCLLAHLDIARDATVMGLLSQFDGTASALLIALEGFKALRSSTEVAAAAGTQRRVVQLQFVTVITLLAFVVSTTAAHYKGLGSVALALNCVTIGSLTWAVFRREV